MGRYSWSDRDTVEECKCVDIPWLAQNGYLRGYVSGTITWTSALSGKSSIGIEVSIYGGYARFKYTQTSSLSGERTDLGYQVQLVTTSCNYGGVRYWFICPLTLNQQACNRRVSKLYLPPGGKYFGCRTCHNLTYRSCKEHDKRVDALLRNPQQVADLLKKRDPTASLLVMKAYLKAIKPL